MNLFDVYPTVPIELVKSTGSYIFDRKGEQYLDFYGGHAVISIGHSHSHYVKCIRDQLKRVSFYSNAIHIPQQEKLAELLGTASGYDDYRLFLCNSGSEAVENALKLASFHTRKRKVVAFKGAFHGRTSGAVAVTNNSKIITPFNAQHQVVFIDYQAVDQLEATLQEGDVCAVITEGIQGVSGIIDPGAEFLKQAESLCEKHQAMFILDEVQSGYGRTGDFFAHQAADINPDLIAVAKGMGNGFPMGGVLIHPKFKAFHGMLGTTFGGNYLACVAGIVVLEVMRDEDLVANARKIGALLTRSLQKIPDIQEIRGRGLMLGLLFDFPVKRLRETLLKEEKVFVGTASNPNILRLLPPLNITPDHVQLFICKLTTALERLRYETENSHSGS
ncbi:MAG: aspartate aminotransferase family protein [Flavobacteriales bacterium Tduv]